MCVYTPNVIQQIIGYATLHSMSFSHMNVPHEVYDLALLFDITQEGPKKHVDILSIGNVHLRNNIGSNKRDEPIAFINNTLNTNIGGMIIGSALFPILFPHRTGDYDGRTTLSKYLKYPMSTLFSPFTLYKPYLLYMYDICQSVQLLKKNSQTCLDKEIKQTKQAHPNMNDAEVLQHVTKYNLPSSIKGSSRW